MTDSVWSVVADERGYDPLDWSKSIRVILAFQSILRRRVECGVRHNTRTEINRIRRVCWGNRRSEAIVGFRFDTGPGRPGYGVPKICEKHCDEIKPFLGKISTVSCRECTQDLILCDLQ